MEGYAGKEGRRAFMRTVWCRLLSASRCRNLERVVESRAPDVNVDS